jgi:predicted DsbA family dithiol-disulfide isomerase
VSDGGPLTLEVFADVGCPFAHLGLLAVVEQCHQRNREVVLRVRSWPLELVNGKPLDAHFIAEEVDEIRPQVAPDQFRGFTAGAFPDSTLPAMELSAAAYAVDDRTGQAVALAVRDALFEQGRNVGDPEVLASIAADHNVPWPAHDLPVSPAQQVRDDWAEGVRRGVVGSPHFFSADGGYFCPALDVSRDSDGHLRVSADRDVLTGFVDGLLGPT